jgi:hypothetical protein
MPDHAQGFWSYVRADDQSGRITRLAENLKREHATQTGGRELELFLDQTSLDWGDDWKAKIEEAIEAATFFIPIITPRYFQSSECREELLGFASQAKDLGLIELLLPIYYVEVPGLRESNDPAMKAVASTKYVDFQHLRLADENSERYLVAVSDLAGRLVGIAEKAERPAAPAARPTVETTPRPDKDLSAEPGDLEHLARMEDVFPRLAETMSSIGNELEEVGSFAEETKREMDESDAASRGFKGRLVVVSRLAHRLQEPADRIESLAASYAADLVEVDPGVLRMIRAAATAEDDREDAETFIREVRKMVGASKEASSVMESLVGILEEAASTSRELRGPLNQIREAIRNLVDGQAIIEGWEKRLDELLREDDHEDGGEPFGVEDVAREETESRPG